MKFILHTENLNVLKRFKDRNWDCVLCEPFFSYRHPFIHTQEAFLALYMGAKEFGYTPYIQINGYIEEDHLEALELWLEKLIQLEPKGIYFNDFAVFNCLKRLGFNQELVYAPETILTNALDIEILLRQVDRVVLSKELTLEEIVQLSQQFSFKIECLGLGYALMSFSKRPLVRNYLTAIKQEKAVLNQLNLRIKESKRDQLFPILEENQGTSIFLDTILFPKEEWYVLKDALLYALHFDDCLLDEKTFIQLIDDLLNEEISINDAKQAVSVKLGQAYFYRKTNMSKEEGI